MIRLPLLGFLFLGGCLVQPSAYREFVATVNYGDLQTYVLEGPRLPRNERQALEVNRFRSLLQEVAVEELNARGFHPAAGLAETDMVLEVEWNTSYRPNWDDSMTGDPERSLDLHYHLNLRIFALSSGEVFWRNASAQTVEEGELTTIRVERLLRDTLAPLPRKEEAPGGGF